MSDDTFTPTPATGITCFDALRAELARFPLSIILLAGRVGVGATFFKAGLLKYHSFEFTEGSSRRNPNCRSSIPLSPRPSRWSRS